MTIYKGKEAVCGVQLTIDRVWRYAMTAEDVLTVKISDEFGNVISTELTNEDVDSVDKQVTVVFTSTQTSQLEAGRGELMAYLTDLVVVQPQKLTIREAL